MKIVKRLDKMFLVAEFPRFNKVTDKYDLYPGDIKVIPDEGHRNFCPEWWWDRMDRREWYWNNGDRYDKMIK